MAVLWFAACILLDFFIWDLVSWIIMSLGFWCFLDCMKTGNERKFITVYDNYRLSFITLINLEAFRSCKHTWKPHYVAPGCSPRAHCRGNRRFSQTGGGTPKDHTAYHHIFLLITSYLSHLCTTDILFSGRRPRGILPHPSSPISW